MKVDNIGSREDLGQIIIAQDVFAVRLVPCFGEGLGEFFAGDADVGDMESHLSEFGTSEDKSQVSIDRDRRVFRSLGEKMIFTVLTSSSLDGVTEAFSE